MKRLHLRAMQVAAAGLLIAGWTPVLGDPSDEAAFHLNMIVEVFPGTVTKPNAQYVMLQAYFAGQNFVAGHKVYFFNAAGVKTDSATSHGQCGQRRQSDEDHDLHAAGRDTLQHCQ